MFLRRDESPLSGRDGRQRPSLPLSGPRRRVKGSGTGVPGPSVPGSANRDEDPVPGVIMGSGFCLFSRGKGAGETAQLGSFAGVRGAGCFVPGFGSGVSVSSGWVMDRRRKGCGP